MAVKVAQSRMLFASLGLEGVLDDLKDEEGVVISGGDVSGGGVLHPKRPGLQVHERLRVDGGNVEVSLVLLVEGGHGAGEGDVELRLISHGELGGVSAVAGFGGVALGEGIDEVALEGGEALLHADGGLGGG